MKNADGVDDVWFYVFVWDVTVLFPLSDGCVVVVELGGQCDRDAVSVFRVISIGRSSDGEPVF